MRHGTIPKPQSLRQQVYLRLRQSIERGTFAGGSKLPASREHARVLGVSRNTILWALERLQAEGYLTARVGDGSYVTERETEPRHCLASSRWSLQSRVPLLSQRGRLIADTALRWKPPTGLPSAFRIGQPAIDEFPFLVWQKLERQTPTVQRARLAHYQDPAGHPPLRQAIAQWLLVSRGIQCDGEQVLITSGSQQAIDLLARLLLDPGDEVLVEDPGYPGIRANLVSQGAVARPVAVDAQGMNIAQGQVQWPRARMAMVTPTHQFPMGVRMGLQRRLELLAWAQKKQAWLVEDDYDSEFQYGDQRIPAMCSMAHGSRVLYVGTFSKTLHPGMRVGFIVLPPQLVDAFASAKTLADRHAPGAVQDVLARFIEEGHLLRHLRRMRALYRERQEAMIHALSKATAGAMQVPFSWQGMHATLETRASVRDTRLVEAAGAVGVYLAPLSRYCIDQSRRGWLLGYAGYPEVELVAAAKRLGKVWR
jgi:GntR family transcriptional regulator / MocR family aminotransferase